MTRIHCSRTAFIWRRFRSCTLDITPLQHFVESGVHEGRQPNPLFDPAWYLQTYPDVAMSGQNPLVYYATRGWKEGHDPSRDSARPTI